MPVVAAFIIATEDWQHMTSPELTGGTGFIYEDAVVARYLAAIICGTTVAVVNSRPVQKSFCFRA